MIKLTSENRQATISTPLGKDKFLIEALHGFESFSEPFSFSAVLLSEDDAIEGNQLIGKSVTVTYLSEDGKKRYFSGIVNRFEYLGQREEPINMSGYEINFVPWLWFLKNNFDCEIFQEQKAPEIIEKIFKDLGYTDYRLKLSESYAEREYCVQYNESDFDFVSRLMEEEGIFYYFKHSSSGHEMVICDSAQGYYEAEDSKVQYTAIGQSHVAHLTGWRHCYEFRPGKFAQRDFNFKQPSDNLETKEKSNAKFENNSNFEVYQYPGLYSEGSAGSRLARVRREQFDAEHDVVEAEGFYATFAPGSKFSVSDHQRQSEKGKSYVVSGINTHLSVDYGFDAGGKIDFHNSFRCIPSETVYRSPAKTRKPVVDGPQTAIVVTDGQEIVVDEFARVKVQFHWDRYGQKNVKSSCWIRVSQVHAGAGWGMIDIPRKDEEVIVSFLDGDPDRPIITGRVYNAQNQPPFGLSGASDNSKNKTRRGNTTKTYQGNTTQYNEITMDDTPGEEEIRIHAQYDMNTVIENDETHEVKNNRTRKVKVDEKVNIGNDQTITVDNNQKTTVGNDQTIAVFNNQKTTVDNEQTVKVGNNQKTTVKNDRKMTVQNNHTEKVAANQKITIGRKQEIKIGVERKLKVGQKNKEQVGFSKEVAVGLNSKHHAGMELKLSAGMKVSIMAGASLELKCGGSSIKMNPGMISIKAPLVKIN